LLDLSQTNESFLEFSALTLGNASGAKEDDLAAHKKKTEYIYAGSEAAFIIRVP